AGLSGDAALLADGTTIATELIDTDGNVLFEDAVVPFGTTELSAAYLGDPLGNYKVSTTPTSAIQATKAATETTLGISAPRVNVGDPMTFVATVRNTSGANLVDPRSGIEILVDGEVVYSEVSSDDGDATPGDGTTQFEFMTSDLT